MNKRDYEINITDIDFGDNDPIFKRFICLEILCNRVYEKFHEVEDGDLVVDIGANVGLFAYSLKDRNPAEVICVEPSNSLYEPLRKNLARLPFKTTIMPYGIANMTGLKYIKETDYVYGDHKSPVMAVITFDDLIKRNDIKYIDFLKVDCEGGEYDIFTEENHSFITDHVGYVAGEWHLSGLEDGLGKFKKFRDMYLTDQTEFKVFEPYIWKDITDHVFDDDYLSRFCDWWKKDSQLMVYMNNE